MIPERLNVIELLVWREIFKAGRWNAGLRHASSIRPPCDPGVKRHVAQHLTRMRRVAHPPVVITLLSEQVFAPSLQTAWGTTARRAMKALQRDLFDGSGTASRHPPK